MKEGFTRKDFFKIGALIGAGYALPRVIGNEIVKPKEEGLPQLNTESFAPALCRQCPALCLQKIRLVAGKPVGVEGMPGHPLNQGTLCPKGFAVLQELYHPDRFTSPLKRRGPRGSGDWEKISWSDATSIMRSKMAAVERKPHSFGAISGSFGLQGELLERFARGFGTPNFWRPHWTPAETPLDAFHGNGDLAGRISYDFLSADLIVSFGWDWLQQMEPSVEVQRIFAELRRGRSERRTRFLQLESQLSISAAKADEWFPLLPGTEGVAALCVAHVLISEGLHDKGLSDQRVNGFEAFKQMVLKEYPPDRAEKDCGMKARDIRRIAQAMSSVKRSLAITWRSNIFNQEAVNSLNILLGNADLIHDVNEFRKISSLPNAPENSRNLPLANIHKWPQAILKSPHSPLEIVLIEGFNPLFTSPESSDWKEALGKIPFVASFSPFMDETSSLSDLILPPSVSMEAWQGGISQSMDQTAFFNFSPPVIKPLHDTKDVGDFILGLAHAVGGRTAAALPWGSFAEALRASAKHCGAKKDLNKGGWHKIAPSIHDANLVRAAQKNRRFQIPVVHSEMANTAYPLKLSVQFPLCFARGEGAHLPYLQSLSGPQLGEQWETWAAIHPETARRLGITDRQIVWIESKAGRIQVKARIYAEMIPDVVSVPFGLGHSKMGRWAIGIGSNPAEIVGVDADSGKPRWQGEPINIHG